MNDITQADVARAIGVSRSMVSFALNAELSKKLNPASLRRVLETAKRLGYRPHRQARILRGGKSGLVGIIASSGPMQPTAERKFFATQAIRAAGYDLTVAEVRWTENDLEQSVEGMLEARVEGVLVAGLMPDRGLTVLRRLCAAGIPVASVNNLELPFVHWAATDYGQGMTELTRHLLDLGHRRLTYLMAWSRKEADTQATVAARRQGFTRAAAHAGLSPEDAVVMYEVPAKRFMDPHRVGKTGMARILKQRKWPERRPLRQRRHGFWRLGGLRGIRSSRARRCGDHRLRQHDPGRVHGPAAHVGCATHRGGRQKGRGTAFEHDSERTWRNATEGGRIPLSSDRAAIVRRGAEEKH